MKHFSCKLFPGLKSSNLYNLYLWINSRFKKEKLFVKRTNLNGGKTTFVMKSWENGRKPFMIWLIYKFKIFSQPAIFSQSLRIDQIEQKFQFFTPLSVFKRNPLKERQFLWERHPERKYSYCPGKFFKIQRKPNLTEKNQKKFIQVENNKSWILTLCWFQAIRYIFCLPSSVKHWHC